MSGMRELFSGLRVSSSGLAAERVRIDVIAKNIANSKVTSSPDGGGAYRRQVVHFSPILRQAQDGRRIPEGVCVSKISDDTTTPMERLYDPGHPDADAQGMVTMPNVDTLREMTDMITAMRAYEANLNAQDTFVRMAERALRLSQ